MEQGHSRRAQPVAAATLVTFAAAALAAVTLPARAMAHAVAVSRGGRVVEAADARANAPTPAAGALTGAVRAPSRPPLPTAGAGSAAAPGGEEGAASAPQGEGDPLVSNGLGSPTCQRGSAGELSAVDQAH